MDIEFELNGVQYRASKLDTFKQFHLSRKIAPVIPTLIPVFMEISRENGDLAKNIDKLAVLLQPFADGLAALSDENSEYMMATCLSVVKRNAGDKWMPIWSQGQKVCLFDDIDLGGMIQICITVIQDSLGSFIQGLLTSQAGSLTSKAE